MNNVACKRVKVVRNISKMELTGFYQGVRNGQERKLEWYQQFWPEQLRNRNAEYQDEKDWKRNSF